MSNSSLTTAGSNPACDDVILLLPENYTLTYNEAKVQLVELAKEFRREFFRDVLGKYPSRWELAEYYREELFGFYINYWHMYFYKSTIMFQLRIVESNDRYQIQVKKAQPKVPSGGREVD